ncbi:isocitrate lyase/PEP mutase family protein [Microvirga thermotolerans]|uniref:Isocitrate lyase/phosphoenolpyruvate mutase family protein n=1 Tax=Microvirga thermotolerans TaxID=2651334 RepID=A0A5P9K0L4_9HYPH|nr:isocitrate lyase/phosphoenolpyruvate mutase family protein [Microvirga thermotolerans]QFU15764.1 isocitrate lyase/phosphoenolpyruvate mutase family protein [Microvirga thermotolerans]
MTARPDAATAFHRLHRGPDLLVLANAWDAGTARLMESVGSRAVATTSAGVAWAHGYADGDTLPVDLLVATAAAIVRAVNVPVSTDIEGGYSDSPGAVGELAARLVDAGVSGINIEDGAGAPDRLCAKIEAVRRAAEARGVNLYINARTDVYLRGLAPPESRVEETLARARRYGEAGASGIFVPGVTAPEDIRRIAAGTELPLNVMARPGLPAGPDLARLGARRLSAGSALSEALFSQLSALARSFLETGDSNLVCVAAKSYGDLNALMSKRA